MMFTSAEKFCMQEAISCAHNFIVEQSNYEWSAEK